MVKVLVYGSKEIYDSASYEGRAEADIVAYRRDEYFLTVVKNRTKYYMGEYYMARDLELDLRAIERDEWDRDMDDYKLSVKYKDHPTISLSKNDQ